MKKKTLALLSSTALLSLALAGTIGAVTVSADQGLSNSETQTGSVEVQHTETAKWTATLSDGPVDNGGTITFEFTDVMTEADKTLKVTVTSSNSWKLKNSDKELEYDVKKGGDSIKGDGVILEEITGESETKKAELTIEITGEAKYAGTYSDTLTFTVSEESVTP